MKKETINQAILKYLKQLNTTDWINNESYKFKFANFLQSNVDFEKQSDAEILSILLESQKIKYHKRQGIQFIQKSGRKSLSVYLKITDIQLFRKFNNSTFENIDWVNRSMSYTVLSAWLSSLFPNKIFPVPITELNETINYLFETDLVSFPKTGKNYISACQEFMRETEEILKNYPVEEIHLRNWNKYFQINSHLHIKQKTKFEKVDWIWLVQDFHLFVHRNILNLYNAKGKDKNPSLIDDFEPTVIEGKSKLAHHMRYERNSKLVRKIKEAAIKSNPMLNCDVCGFSFFEKYGVIGQGFIEAHHKNPLSKTKETKTTKKDIALVCSNCHRMIHKGISQKPDNLILSIDEIKKLLQE